jgi:hypothetical protein
MEIYIKPWSRLGEINVKPQARSVYLNKIGYGGAAGV